MPYMIHNRENSKTSILCSGVKLASSIVRGGTNFIFYRDVFYYGLRWCRCVGCGGCIGQHKKESIYLRAFTYSATKGF